MSILREAAAGVVDFAKPGDREPVTQTSPMSYCSQPPGCLPQADHKLPLADLQVRNGITFYPLVAFCLQDVFIMARIRYSTI